MQRKRGCQLDEQSAYAKPSGADVDPLQFSTDNCITPSPRNPKLRAFASGGVLNAERSSFPEGESSRNIWISNHHKHHKTHTHHHVIKDSNAATRPPEDSTRILPADRSPVTTDFHIRACRPTVHHLGAQARRWPANGTEGGPGAPRYIYTSLPPNPPTTSPTVN